MGEYNPRGDHLLTISQNLAKTPGKPQLRAPKIVPQQTMQPPPAPVTFTPAAPVSSTNPPASSASTAFLPPFTIAASTGLGLRENRALARYLRDMLNMLDAEAERLMSS